MDKMMKSAMRVMVFMMSACLILWIVLPKWQTVTLGLLAGLAASSMNALLLKRRVNMISQAAMGEGSKKRRSLGFGSRIAMVLMVAMLAYRYPESLNMPAALLGSMVMPFVILVVAIIHNVKENK
ncbi:MAG: ATP synthase subunit I [Candidatus Pristimantibacillus sp.]